MGKWYRAGTALVGVSLVLGALAGCGGSSGTSSTTGGGGGNKQLVIATELPVSGTDAGVGLPTEYGANLAIQQNHDLGNGYTLTVKNYNDEGTSGPDGSIGVTNVTSAVSDSSIVAIVGPFNSGIAKVEIPVITRGHLVEISPANTNPGLTLQQYAADNGIVWANLHPAGTPEYYFRIPGNDVVQGKVDAQVAANAPINAKTVYVTDDNTTYGKGLAKYFTDSFTAGGGNVVGSAEITPDQISNLPSLAATIKSKNPDVVFFGGVTSGGGGALKKDLVAAGYNGPMVGGDGIADDPSWLTTAGTAAINTYGSVAAPDTSQFQSGAAADFVKAFKAAYPSTDVLPYSAMAYDAAMIEIKAIKNVIASGKPVTRENVRDAVASIQYSGVTGQISFDSNGDNAGNKVFSIYGIDASSNGQWKFEEEVNV